MCVQRLDGVVSGCKSAASCLLSVTDELLCAGTEQPACSVLEARSRVAQHHQHVTTVLATVLTTELTTELTTVLTTELTTGLVAATHQRADDRRTALSADLCALTADLPQFQHSASAFRYPI